MIPAEARLSGGVLLSSRNVGWTGIIVDRYRVGPGEAVSEPTGEHRVSVHLGASHHLHQERGGRARKTLHHAGDVLVVAEGESTRLNWNTPAEFLRMRLSATWIRSIAEALGRHPDRVRLHGGFSRPDPRASHLGLALLKELEAGAPNGTLYGDSIAMELATHLIGQADDVAPTANPANGQALAPVPRSGLPPGHWKRVVEFIHANLSQPLTLSDLAAVVRLSPFHFARLFRQSLGVAPHQYVIRARVEEAQRLLATGGLRVAETAARVGFASQSHLSRHMRRLHGVTPGTFARMHRAR